MTVITVKGAGHMVPEDQPKSVFQLFYNFVNNKGVNNQIFWSSKCYLLSLFWETAFRHFYNLNSKCRATNLPLSEDSKRPREFYSNSERKKSIRKSKFYHSKPVPSKLHHPNLKKIPEKRFKAKNSIHKWLMPRLPKSNLLWRRQ